MKIYLIAALFLVALVVAHAEDSENVKLPEQPEQLDQPEEEVKDPAEESTGETENEEAENEEEDPDKRRRRNVLSLFSCIQLKRRGYCRTRIIRSVCAATCYVYDPCRNYAVLNQLNRKQSRNRGNVLLCDQKNFAKRWYRFTGFAGTKMPTRAPPKNRCGTHAPGWMVGSYPRRRNQVVRRKVCYHWGNSRCKWHNFIRVKNCGGYYVFYLPKTPVCNLRYCGNA